MPICDLLLTDYSVFCLLDNYAFIFSYYSVCVVLGTIFGILVGLLVAFLRGR